MQIVRLHHMNQYFVVLKLDDDHGDDDYSYHSFQNICSLFYEISIMLFSLETAAPVMLCWYSRLFAVVVVVEH